MSVAHLDYLYSIFFFYEYIEIDYSNVTAQM